MVRKLIYWLVSIITLIGVVGYLGALNMPLVKINDFTPIKLYSAQGTLRKGHINGIEINGERLSLDCQLSGNLISTTFQCEKPFVITGNLHVSLDGTATFKNTKFLGELANASDWMRALKLPPGLNAKINIKIPRAKIINGLTTPLLSELEINGKVNDISLMRFKLFTDANIGTEQPNNPITLTIDARNANQNATQLNLTSIITDNVYVTTGTLTGENLAMLSGVLNYFGRPISTNEWQIRLQGRVF